jgi:hypothetical protein
MELAMFGQFILVFERLWVDHNWAVFFTWKSFGLTVTGPFIFYLERLWVDHNWAVFTHI